MSRHFDILIGPTSFLGGVAAEAGLVGFGSNSYQPSLDTKAFSFEAENENPASSLQVKIRSALTSQTLQDEPDLEVSKRGATETKTTWEPTKPVIVASRVGMPLAKSTLLQPPDLTTAKVIEAELTARHNQPTSFDRKTQPAAQSAIEKTTGVEFINPTKTLVQDSHSQPQNFPKQRPSQTQTESGNLSHGALQQSPDVARVGVEQPSTYDRTHTREENLPFARSLQPEALNPRTTVHIGTLEIQIEAPRPMPNATRRETPVYQSNSFSRFNIRGR
jgi:hypothetical protein